MVGVDLSQDLDAQTFGAIDAAYTTHTVIVFCNRRLTPEHLLRFPPIRELSDFVTRPEFMYRHTWGVGDLLMWDNCCAQHLAVKDYELPQRRLMYRVTVNDSMPVEASL